LYHKAIVKEKPKFLSNISNDQHNFKTGLNFQDCKNLAYVLMHKSCGNSY